MFTDTELEPQVFSNVDISNTTAYVVFYNNSNKPKTTITLTNLSKNVIRVNYIVNNESITHEISAGVVNFTSKNVPYMLIQPVNIWSTSSGNLTHIRNSAVFAGNVTNDIQITVSDPFKDYTISKFEYSEIEYSGADSVFSPIFTFVAFICVILVAGVALQIRRGLKWQIR